MDEPLIHTSKGNLPITSLRYEHHWEETDTYIKFVERYFLQEEVVKESAHEATFSAGNLSFSPPAPTGTAATPGKLPPWPWSWTHDAEQQKPDSPQFIRNLQRAMLREQELRAQKAKLEREFSEKKLAAASVPAAQQKSALQNREYAILRRKIRAAEEDHSKAVTAEIELRLRAMEYETAQQEAVAARRKRELMMVLLLA